MRPRTAPALCPPPSSLGLDAYWRAANYLSVGQIYLLDNPLLREPLRPEHIKPRLLGHWGTTPGLNFIYAHLNRVIRNARPRTPSTSPGPATAGPASSPTPTSRAPTARSTRTSARTRRACAGCSASSPSPAASPATSRPRRPGSIHEGGELGYALAHAYGAAFDNPDLLVACVVGDGEAETGPLATSWHSNKFLNPVTRRRRAADPAPQRLQDRQPDGAGAHRATSELRSLLEGYGYAPHFVDGRRPAADAPADGGDARRGRSSEIAAHPARGARATASRQRPRWPMIVLRTPKGWTGPKIVDGLPVEGTFRSHQVPIAEVRTNPEHLAQLEAWMRSYRPEELFDEDGRAARRAGGAWRPRATAHERQPARQRRPAAARPRPAGLPRLRGRRCPSPARARARPPGCSATSCAT